MTKCELIEILRRVQYWNDRSGNPLPLSVQFEIRRIIAEYDFLREELYEQCKQDAALDRGLPDD